MPTTPTATPAAAAPKAAPKTVTPKAAPPKAATPMAKKARPAAKRPAPSKSSRPAGDKRVALKDIAPAKKKPAAAQAKPVAADAVKKPHDAGDEQKVVRDGFTMPQADYAKLKSLKAICIKGGVAVKKSELLRAGLQVLAALPVQELLLRIQGLPPVKAGRKKTKG